jgi:tRNA modification GTPase
MAGETIFASGTGAGRAAIAVIRLSGPRAAEALARLAGALPAARFANFVKFRHPVSNELLDEGLALWFPGPRSPTGEDYAELHIHGGRAILAVFFGALGALPGLRAAEPGEFARRGFANGKLDLSQAEGLADLIEAQTEAQRKQALRLAGGALRRRIETWRDVIIHARAMMEAQLDFSDEGDVSALQAEDLQALLAPVVAQMRADLGAAPASEHMRDGFRVFLTGPPNAGKSTLLNALAQRDVAIVSDIPGTTRDMIEVHLDLGGLPVTLVDTAGLRDSENAIERLGVARVRARLAEADLVLWLTDSGQEVPAEWRDSAAPVVSVRTKADLGAAPRGLSVSAKTGAGLGELLAEIGARAGAQLGDGSSALLSRSRHRESIASAAQALETAFIVPQPLELAAEELRAASAALGRIVGACDVEDILDAIFSRFCIGK